MLEENAVVAAEVAGEVVAKEVVKKSFFSTIGGRFALGGICTGAGVLVGLGIHYIPKGVKKFKEDHKEELEERAAKKREKKLRKYVSKIGGELVDEDEEE